MVLRYRRSSLKTMLGITAEKKRLKRELGITAVEKPFRWWGNEKRDIKRRLGYYSPLARFIPLSDGSRLGGSLRSPGKSSRSRTRSG